MSYNLDSIDYYDINSQTLFNQLIHSVNQELNNLIDKVNGNQAIGDNDWHLLNVFVIQSTEAKVRELAFQIISSASNTTPLKLSTMHLLERYIDDSSFSKYALNAMVNSAVSHNQNLLLSTVEKISAITSKYHIDENTKVKSLSALSKQIERTSVISPTILRNMEGCFFDNVEKIRNICANTLLTISSKHNLQSSTIETLSRGLSSDITLSSAAIILAKLAVEQNKTLPVSVVEKLSTIVTNTKLSNDTRYNAAVTISHLLEKKQISPNNPTILRNIEGCFFDNDEKIRNTCANTLLTISSEYNPDLSTIERLAKGLDSDVTVSSTALILAKLAVEQNKTLPVSVVEKLSTIVTNTKLSNDTRYNAAVTISHLLEKKQISPNNPTILRNIEGCFFDNDEKIRNTCANTLLTISSEYNPDLSTIERLAKGLDSDVTVSSTALILAKLAVEQNKTLPISVVEKLSKIVTNTKLSNDTRHNSAVTISHLLEKKQIYPDNPTLPDHIGYDINQGFLKGDEKIRNTCANILWIMSLKYNFKNYNTINTFAAGLESDVTVNISATLLAKLVVEENKTLPLKVIERLSLLFFHTEYPHDTRYNAALTISNYLKNNKIDDAALLRFWLMSALGKDQSLDELIITSLSYIKDNKKTTLGQPAFKELINFIINTKNSDISKQLAVEIIDGFSLNNISLDQFFDIFKKESNTDNYSYLLKIIKIILEESPQLKLSIEEVNVLSDLLKAKNSNLSSEITDIIAIAVRNGSKIPLSTLKYFENLLEDKNLRDLALGIIVKVLEVEGKLAKESISALVNILSSLSSIETKRLAILSLNYHHKNSHAVLSDNILSNLKSLLNFETLHPEISEALLTHVNNGGSIKGWEEKILGFKDIEKALALFYAIAKKREIQNEKILNFLGYSLILEKVSSFAKEQVLSILKKEKANLSQLLIDLIRQEELSTILLNSVDYQAILEEIKQFVKNGQKLTHNLLSTLEKFLFQGHQGEQLLNEVLEYIALNDQNLPNTKLGKFLGLEVLEEKTQIQLIEELMETNKDSNFINEALLKGFVVKVLEEVAKFDVGVSKIFAHKDTIDKWKVDEIKQWVIKFKASIPPTKDGVPTQRNFIEENLAEFIAILKRAVELTYNYTPRLIQVISSILLWKESGNLAKVATGEGKSIIIVMSAILKAFEGRSIDIITSSPILAERDAEEQKPLYQLFDLTVGCNSRDKSSEKSDNPYLNNIVYGDITSFIGDLLNQKYNKNDVNRSSKFDVVIIDEVDSMLIDQSSHIVMLSHKLPGFEYLEQILVALWKELELIKQRFIRYEGELLWSPNDFTYQNGELEILSQEPDLYKVDDEIKFTRELLTSYINALISDSSVFIPKHLKDFAINQISNWIDSAITALNMEENKNYVLEYYNGEVIIAPVDYQNTGVIQTKMNWSNGLHQFLQIKHGIKIKAETLITSFMSNMGYLKGYKEIIGLSGTLGGKYERELLNEIYNVKFIEIPTYAPKKFFKYQPIIVNSEEAWVSEIINSVKKQASLGKAILVICQTIKDVNLIERLLKESGYPISKIKRYTNNNNSELLAVSNKLDSEEVIIATNLAGRGTDIKTTSKVEVSGGLHVIVSYLPTNSRVEEQALGRTARQGKSGTGELIIKHEIVNNIEDLLYLRELSEKQKLRVDKYRTSTVELRDELFKRFLEFLDPFIGSSRDSQFYKNYKVKHIEELWAIWLKEQMDAIEAKLDFSKQSDDATIMSNNRAVRDEALSNFEKFKQSIISGSFKDNVIYLTKEGKQSGSMGLLDKAILADDVYSFVASYSKAALFITANQEKKKIESDYHNGTKRSIIESLLDARNKTLNYIIPQFESSYVMLSSEQDFESKELAKQTKFKSDVLKKKIEYIDKAIDVVSNSRSNELIKICSKVGVGGGFNTTEYKNEIDEFNEMGLDGFYELEAFVPPPPPEEEKGFWGSLFSCVVGIFKAVVGTIITLASGGLAAEIGGLLVASGINDIFQGIKSVVTGKGMSIDDYLSRQGIDLAIRFITLGVDKAFQYVKTALNIKPIFQLTGKVAEEGGKKILTKQVISEAINHTKNELIKQGAIAGLGYAIEAIGSDILESNRSDFSNNIRAKIKDMLSTNREELIRLLTLDSYLGESSYQAKLANLAYEVLSSYYSQFNSVAFTIAKGALMGSKMVAGMKLILSGVELASTLNRISQVTDDFCTSFSNRITAMVHNAAVISDILAHYLNEMKVSNVGWVMSVLKDIGVIRGGYFNSSIRDAAELASILEQKLVTENLRNLYGDKSKIKEGVLSIYELSRDDHRGSLDLLESRLTEYLTSAIMKMIKSHAIGPASGMAAEFVVNKIHGQIQNAKLNSQEALRNKQRMEDGSHVLALDAKGKPYLKPRGGAAGGGAGSGGSPGGGSSGSGDDEGFERIMVEKGHTVWRIYGNKPTQRQLEEFVENNPYIAARGVGRDAKGNITHLNIQVGERISVPKYIANSYKSGYSVNAKSNPIAEEVFLEAEYTCPDSNAPNFPVAIKQDLGMGEGKINSLDISYSEKQKAKYLLKASLKELGAMSDGERAKLTQRKEKGTLGRMLDAINPFHVEEAQAAVPLAIAACAANPACAAAAATLTTASGIALSNAIKATSEHISSDSISEKSKHQDQSKVDKQQKLIKQLAGKTGTGMPDPNNNNDDDDDRWWKPEDHGWSKNKDGRWINQDGEKAENMVPNRPQVNDRDLQEIFKQLYRSTDKRPGGTAEELRREVQYGRNIKGHLFKAEQRLQGIKNRIADSQNPLPRDELKAAERVMNDLRDAINKAKGGK